MALKRFIALALISVVWVSQQGTSVQASIEPIERTTKRSPTETLSPKAATPLNSIAPSDGLSGEQSLEAEAQRSFSDSSPDSTEVALRRIHDSTKAYFRRVRDREKRRAFLANVKEFQNNPQVSLLLDTQFGQRAQENAEAGFSDI